MTRFTIHATLLMTSLASAAVAQDQPTLDELLDLQPPATREQTPAPPPPADEDPVMRRLEGEPAASDPLGEAVGQMQAVTSRLGREQDTGLTTQRLMESILDKLDQLIAQAQQQQQQQSSSSSSSSSQASNQDSQSQQVAQQGEPSPGGQPGQGQQQAGAAADPGDMGPTRGSPVEQAPDHRPMEALRREWGNLPPRLRDELREGLDERFSPVYQQLTEAYYRRLAEEE